MLPQDGCGKSQLNSVTSDIAEKASEYATKSTLDLHAQCFVLWRRREAELDINTNSTPNMNVNTNVTYHVHAYSISALLIARVCLSIESLQGIRTRSS